MSTASTVRRTQAPTPVVQQLEDAARTAIDDVQAQVDQRYGAIDQLVKRSTFTAQFGQVALVDAKPGAFTVWLPHATRDRTNQSIIVKKANASTNVITVKTQQGDTIDGVTSIPMPTGYEWLIAVCAGEHLWVLLNP